MPRGVIRTIAPSSESVSSGCWSRSWGGGYATHDRQAARGRQELGRQLHQLGAWGCL